MMRILLLMAHFIFSSFTHCSQTQKNNQFLIALNVLSFSKELWKSWETRAIFLYCCHKLIPLGFFFIWMKDVVDGRIISLHSKHRLSAYYGILCGAKVKNHLFIMNWSFLMNSSSCVDYIWLKCASLSRIHNLVY